MSSGLVLVSHKVVVMITYAPNLNGMRDARMSLLENSITVKHRYKNVDNSRHYEEYTETF